MVSSQTRQLNEQLDELISRSSEDFTLSGLKSDSVIRITRLAVVNESILIGGIGEIAKNRLTRIKNRLSSWILSD